MRKSMTGLSLAVWAIIGVAGCAHQKSACTSCTQTATSTKTASSTVPDSVPKVAIWNVIRNPDGSKNKYLMVDKSEVSATTASTTNRPTQVKLADTTANRPSNVKVKDVPALTVSTNKPTSPYGSSATVVVPPKRAVAEIEVARPTTLPEASADPLSALEVQRPVIAANPNLKPGMKEIVRENLTKTYAHADDYTWLMGELEYLHGKKVWRVRFAKYDEADKYGGCFTLVGCEEKLEKFQNGDLVKVDGFLLDPEAKQAAPEFKATEITPLVTREVVDVKVDEKK